jgi:cytochrome c biogenesis protein CcmG/thiol:disulfide interchange protein DsbE
MKLRLWQILLLLLTVGLVLVLALQLRNVNTAPQVGKPAPAFTATGFDGSEISLPADGLGKVVVINFWASWCIPCETEAREIERIWQDYQARDVLVLGIDYADTRSKADLFIAKYGITYLNAMDTATLTSRAYRIRGVPETYIVAQDGTIAQIFIGPTTYNQIASTLENLLK